MRPDVKSMDRKELAAFVAELGEKPFRAIQLFEWLHAKRADSFEEMTNLSGAFRKRLAESSRLVCLKQVKVQVSADGTRKYLFALEDGNVIESVLMRYRHGNSVCISSQAGCRMGCRFCASTLDGLVRNLAPSEIPDREVDVIAHLQLGGDGLGGAA